MAEVFSDTLRIGMIGHSALLRQNIIRFQQIQHDREEQNLLQITAFPVYNNIQIAQSDGILITGWQPWELYRRVVPLRQSILEHLDTLSLWGIAAGSSMLGRNSVLPVIDCDITIRPGYRLSTSMLDFPGNTPRRITGCFVPAVQFVSPAPNLAILCQHQTHGIVAVRQGNHLASSFAAELTPQLDLYQYWLEMVLRLKEWQI